MTTLKDIVRFSRIPTNGINLHVAEAGPPGGPLIFLLHGFPEFWYGWRNQIAPLAERGFHVIAPDQRGYNLSDKPADIGSYDLDRLAADIVGLADHFGVEQFAIVGHDWGASVGWWAAGKYEQLPALAVELAQLPVELIVAVSGAAAAAQHATPTMPIVFVAVGDPLTTGLVQSLARPGGNVTGITNWADVLMGKRLELLKEVVPGLSRVAVLWYKAQSTGGTPSALQELEHAAGALAIPLDIMEVQGLQALEGDGSALNTTQADALIVLPSVLFYQQRVRLVELLAQHRLPAMYAAREFVEAGGLLAYGPFLPDLFRRAATYVDKILKGAKPADLPVEQPTKLEFVINLKVAQALGLTISPMLLFRADEVIR